MAFTDFGIIPTYTWDQGNIQSDIWQETAIFGADQVFVKEKLATLETELEQAVFISLFTDKRFDREGVLQDTQQNDIRGWWDDINEGEELGSDFWQLFKRKATDDLVNEIKEAAEDALQWMLDDLIASEVNVTVVRTKPTNYSIVIEIVKEQKILGEFKFLWDELKASKIGG